MEIHFRKVARAIILFFIVSLLCSCSEMKNKTNDNSGTVSIVTVSNSETDSTTVETDISSVENNYTSDIQLGVNLNEFKIVDDFQPFTIPEKYKAQIEDFCDENEFNGTYIFYSSCNGFQVIAPTSSEWQGQLSAHNYFVFDEKNIVFIPSKIFLHTNDPYIFIIDNILYYYDYSIGMGYTHTTFFEFSLEDGEKINEYDETYSLGSATPDYFINTFDEITSSYELEEYMKQLSDTWYRFATADTSEIEYI